MVIIWELIKLLSKMKESITTDKEIFFSYIQNEQNGQNNSLLDQMSERLHIIVLILNLDMK